MPAQNSAEALQELQTIQGTVRNPLDIYNEQSAALGVGDVRGRVSTLRTTLLNTENALNAVDPSVTGRTAGTLTTEAQRQRIVNLERAPIVGQYGQQQGALSNENATLADLMGQAGQTSQLAYQGEQQKLSNAKDIYSTMVQKEAEARRQAEADRAYQLQMAQFEESKKAAARTAASSGGRSTGTAGAGAGTNRAAYDGDLGNLESALKSGKAPNYEQAVSSLVSKYAGRGISPQEIGDYVYQLYGRFFNTAGTKRFYG